MDTLYLFCGMIFDLFESMKTSNIKVRIGVEDKKKLDHLTNDLGVSLSAFIIMLFHGREEYEFVKDRVIEKENSKQIMIRLTPELKSRIAKVAKQEYGITISRLIRSLIKMKFKTVNN